MKWRNIMIPLTLIITAGCADDNGGNNNNMNNETSDQSVNYEQNEQIAELEETVTELEAERDQLQAEISALEAEQSEEDANEEADAKGSLFGEDWTPHKIRPQETT